MKKLITLLSLSSLFCVKQGLSQIQNSLKFDGVNDYVETPLILDTSNFKNWTIECWVKSPAIPAAGTFSGPAYGDNLGIIWNHSNTSYQGAATVQAAGGAFYSASFGSLTADAWIHLAATFDGTLLKAYKNGTLVSTVTTTGGLKGYNSLLKLGKHPSMQQFWKGNMDELKIWSVARSAAEIRSGVYSQIDTASPNLLAYYDFNQGIPAGLNTSITQVIDNTSLNNTGILYGFDLDGSASNFVDGVDLGFASANNSINLDGTDDCLNTDISFSNTTYANWTLECWVNGNALPGTGEYNGPIYGENLGIIWDHANFGGQPRATVMGANGSFYFASFGPVSAGTWYHLAATYNGSVLKAYKNGVLISSVTVVGGGLTSSSQTLKLGKHPTVNNFFAGKIDEVRIWNIARSCSEINNTMNTVINANEVGLQAYYSFNHGVADASNSNLVAVQDLTPYKHAAVLSGFSLSGSSSNFVNGAPLNAPVANCVSTGLHFDGSNDFINSTLSQSNSVFNRFTIECWVKGHHSPVSGTGAYNGPAYQNFMGIIWDHQNPAFMGSATVGTTSGAFYAASFGSLNADEWYHLAATYDGMELKAYKNGKLITTVSAPGVIKSSSSNFLFGKHPTLNNFFAGTIDEIRVWTTARSCEEINDNMNKELTGSEPGLRLYYDFNQGIAGALNTSATIVGDRTSYSNNGTLNGFTLNGSTSNYLDGTPLNAVNPDSCSISTGVKQNNTSSQLIVYPNPTSGLFLIQTGEKAVALVQVTNVIGQVVTEAELSSGSGIVDLTAQPNGVYLVKVLIDNHLILRKVFKE